MRYQSVRYLIRLTCGSIYRLLYGCGGRKSARGRMESAVWLP